MIGGEIKTMVPAETGWMVTFLIWDLDGQNEIGEPNGPYPIIGWGLTENHVVPVIVAQQLLYTTSYFIDVMENTVDESMSPRIHRVGEKVDSTWKGTRLVDPWADGTPGNK